MDFRLLADVWQQDGERLGELRHVIYDPETGQILSLVVQQEGMRGRAVIVPIGDVVDTEPDGTVTYVGLSPEEFSRLEPYGFAENIAPPPADIDPIHNQSADFEEELIDVPDVAPVGAAEGITSIAYTPMVVEVLNVPEGAVVIDDGTEVHATDGPLGRLSHVVTEDGGLHVRAFVVEKGLVFAQDFEVTLDRVGSVQSEIITLTVEKETIEASSEGT